MMSVLSILWHEQHLCSYQMPHNGKLSHSSPFRVAWVLVYLMDSNGIWKTSK